MTLIYEELTKKIIGAAIEVHRILGPGLLESTYQQCLCHELVSLGISCKTEVALPVKYKDVYVECGYRMDLVVEDAVIIEIKSIDEIAAIHEAQLLTYLKLSKYKIGLLMNFNVQKLVNGIIRRAL
jgi:GxxExxY protein